MYALIKLPRWTQAILLILLLAACAHQRMRHTAPASTPGTHPSPAPARTVTAAHQSYTRGLKHYKIGDYDAALADFRNALAAGNLSETEAVDAHKHAAFIYCMTRRESQCREEFRAVLALDRNFNLAPDEIDHPIWGPVWRSVRASPGVAAAPTAGAAQQRLAEAKRRYQEKDYRHTVWLAHDAMKLGLHDRADEIDAHKLAAFAYCQLREIKGCRKEFYRIFTLDPSFTLAPAEAGQAAWATTYQHELEIARHRRR